MRWNWLTNEMEQNNGVVTIYEFQRGLLYRDGALERVLEAGRYRLWGWQRRRIVVVDVRRATAQIANQKLLTADQVTVTLNLVADYEVADVALSRHAVADFRVQLYEDVQLAARQIVGALTVDEFLERREEINARLLETVSAAAQGYGVRVLLVAVKDVVLSAKVRDMLMKQAEARRSAQAMLIGAREEVAAMRALANAARMAADNPELLRLRELDTARAFAANPGNTVVLGVNSALPLPRPAKTAPVAKTEPTEIED